MPNVLVPLFINVQVTLRRLSKPWLEYKCFFIFAFTEYFIRQKED